MTRQERFEEVLVGFTWQEPTENPSAASAADHRFALIEESAITGLCWLMLGDSIEELRMYHDGQEYPEDWIPEYILDLDTGDRWFADRIHTTFANYGPEG